MLYKLYFKHAPIKDFVFEEGFSINSKKTRVARKNTRQEVTGIVVISHMQLSREKRRIIRQQVYYIRKFGLDSHLEHIHELRAHYLNHLLGLVNFALFVNPKDEEMQKYFDFLKTLFPKKSDIESKIDSNGQKQRLTFSSLNIKDDED